MWYLKPEWMIVWVTIAYTVVSTLALIAIAAQVWITRDSAQRQLRAYLITTIGLAIFQQRRTKEEGGDLKFECRPNLINTGQTPAHEVKFRARAAIHPHPLPKGINLPEQFNEDDGVTMFGSQQSANMFAIVDGFCADDEVDDIKTGFGKKGLYVWGLITYKDVFGKSHYTRFCHYVYWQKDGTIRGIYVSDRNGGD